MKIPKSIKINGIIYDIVEEDPKDGHLVKVKNWGEISFQECKIYIDKNTDTQRQWQILFHEILHAIECDNEMDSQETYIQTISSNFYGVLKDNNLLKE
jgi:hypothetical protein